MEPQGSILIVDDNEGILKSLRYTLKFEFAQVKAVKNPNQIPSLLQSESFDVILLDMNFAAGTISGNEGIFWLNEILKQDPDAVVVLITAYGDVELAVRTIKEGATDFILKPWDNEKLISTLQTAYRLRQSKREVVRLQSRQEHLSEETFREFGSIIGESEAIGKVHEVVKKVAVTDANILILGENGTGKELIAREIHRLSQRLGEVFISVDMAALSENLIESELFGHVQGAFTDARKDRTGKFESASSGTLFLDEIGNIPMSVQAKLLNALQSRIITRVGSNKPIPVDIRLISATNRSIRQMISESLFREDLYFRINTIEVTLPPLRERGEDIVLLSEHFLARYGKKYDKPGIRIDANAIRKLSSYRWPGNIRELQHTIEKAVILCDTKVITPDLFMFRMGEEPAESGDDVLNLDQVEKMAISRALKKCKGNLSNTANELGITRKTLYSKIHKYGL